MPILIDNSNTTDKQVSASKDPGWFCIQLDCAAGSSATIDLYRRSERSEKEGTEQDLPFTLNGTPVQLTAGDPAKELSVGDEHVVVQRSGGTDLITVKMNKMTTNP